MTKAGISVPALMTERSNHGVVSWTLGAALVLTLGCGALAMFVVAMILFW
jgi:hypothetical protein